METENRPTLAETVARSRARSDTDPTWRTNYATETEATRATRELADEFVQRTHMCDWTQNERRQELAEQLNLANPWQSHAAYLEAWRLSGRPI